MIFDYGKNVDDDKRNIEDIPLKFWIRKKNSTNIIRRKQNKILKSKIL